MVDYFADTYALVANYKGSRRYRPYFARKDVVTTTLNLVEFAFMLHARAGVREADLGPYIVPLQGALVEPDRSIAGPAAAFKASMARSRRQCSYVDAYGYAAARWLGVPFLTGDEDFRRVPHVEFVKE